MCMQVGEIFTREKLDELFIELISNLQYFKRTQGRDHIFSLHYVLRIFLQNFGDESQFWWILVILISTSKFWKNLVRIVTLYWDQFWKILTFEFGWNRQSYDKPPWRNFVFLFKFEYFRENRKFEIFNPSSNPNFWSLTLNPNLRFWQILDLSSI